MGRRKANSLIKPDGQNIDDCESLLGDVGFVRLLLCSWVCCKNLKINFIQVYCWGKPCAVVWVTVLKMSLSSNNSKWWRR